MIPVIAIAGPTAAGKSRFALTLWEALARTTDLPDAELVSVDSAQIYRGMDIGSAKPDRQTRQRVPHHLIDLLDPSEAYSAARFAEDARASIATIRARGRMPILVGGTFLYFRALFEGLSTLPAADPAVRAALEQERARIGAAGQHARLAVIDSDSAARLHPNDAQRVLRALEIFAVSGQPASALYRQPGSTGPGDSGGPVCRIALLPADPAALDRAIAVRLQAMLQAGFIEEVAALRARGDLHLGLPSMRAVGYRQFWRYLDGDCTRDEAVRLAQIATRQYAKRQRTWLRGDPVWQSGRVSEPPLLAQVLNGIRKATGINEP